ncbi:MAG: 1-deoxy-D-xylulose-5-phosphate reductoisomerase [Candidatus Omnitrophota bacterium]|nr:1-deoxy-D-xylulose-5-phosphate reductoisomerase [Candidatus Omnitrophota bacterium]
MKNITILGSTGSIGQNALEAIRRFPGEFHLVGLSANSNISILERQIKEFKPFFVCVSDLEAARKLKSRISHKTKVVTGEDGLKFLVSDKKTDKILIAINGSAALSPLLKAIDCAKEIALANKEALVAAGPLVMDRAKEKGALILPVDSEASAIWQCLEGRNRVDLKSIYLTGSGGPFRNTTKEQLKRVGISKVLAHPRWKMGKKITVNSATLMNKGLELLEIMFLFRVPLEKVKILVHPESILHSMVEFIDGTFLAQLSAADMCIPIQYALSYPKRLSNFFPSVDFYKLKKLNFEKPDFEKFPCLKLAYQAASELGTKPAVLNAANEVCVEEFLKNRLRFLGIAKVVEKVLRRHRNIIKPCLGDILEADAWAREEAERVIG